MLRAKFYYTDGTWGVDTYKDYDEMYWAAFNEGDHLIKWEILDESSDQ